MSYWNVDRLVAAVVATGHEVQRAGINPDGSIFAELKQPPPTVGSCLYILATAATWPVKIGFTTKSVSARIKALQTGCPDELRLICSAPATRLEEQTVHNTFAACRVKGEWFRASPQLTRFIRAISRGTPILQALPRRHTR